MFVFKIFSQLKFFDFEYKYNILNKIFKKNVVSVFFNIYLINVKVQ